MLNSFFRVNIYIYIYMYLSLYIWYSFWPNVFRFHIESWPEWGSNPQPRAYCAHALTTEIFGRTTRRASFWFWSFQNVSGKTKLDKSFSCSLTYQKIPSQDQLVLPAANSFELMASIFNQESVYNWCKN